MMCRHLVNYRIELCPDHHLISVHFLNSASMVCYFVLFRQVLFRYGTVIAYVFCHAGVLVCLFVVKVADFCYVVIENQLSNSKLHY